jgi:hypothetical protein
MSSHTAKNYYKLMVAAFCFACLLLALIVRPAVAQKDRTVDVPKEIVQQLVKDEELKEFIQLKPDGGAENLVAKPIDLDPDGIPELQVHEIGSICGAANCVTWIHRKAGACYQLLLDAGTIQDIQPQKTFTHDYRDIMTSTHGSAWDSGLELYKFDGKQYRRVAMLLPYISYKDKRGNYREWKRPRITRAKCEPEP